MAKAVTSPMPKKVLSAAALAFVWLATFPALSALSPIASTAFAGPVTQHGRLYASDNKIVGVNSGDGVPVQLKGPSMQWSVSGWGSDRFSLRRPSTL